MLKNIIILLFTICIQNIFILNANSELFFKDKDLDDYNKEIKKNPLVIENYFMLGLYFQERENYNKAIEQFNKVLIIPENKALIYDSKNWKIKKDPVINDRIYFLSKANIGYCYYYQKKFDETINQLNKAIKEHKNYLKKDYFDGGYFYYILGRSYYKLNDYNNSLIFYYKGLKYNDYHGELYNAISYSYLKQGNKEKSLKMLEKNIQLNPNYVNGYDSIAEYYLNEGNNDLAYCYYEKACKLGKKLSCDTLKKLHKK